MPRVGDMIVSKFLKQGDFEEDTVCNIKDVKLEEVAQGETKWILYFKEYQKGLVLNITTIRVLEKAFGDNSDDWLGKKVLVYVDPNITFQGQVVGGIRLRPPRRTAPVVAAAPKTVEADPDFDSDIPF